MSKRDKELLKAVREFGESVMAEPGVSFTNSCAHKALMRAIRYAIEDERTCCARVCEQVAEDLLDALQREEGCTYEEANSAVASARVCARELLAGGRV